MFRSSSPGVTTTTSRGRCSALRRRTSSAGQRPVDHVEDTTGDVETLVYHTGDGWMQTTLAYWQEVLEHRARMHEATTLERAAGPIGVE